MCYWMQMNVAISQLNIIFRKSKSKHVALFFLNTMPTGCKIHLYKECMWKIPVFQTGLHLLENTHIQNRPVSFPACFIFSSSGELSLDQWLSTVITSNFSHGHQLFLWISIFLLCWKSSSSLQIFFTSSVNSFNYFYAYVCCLSVLHVVPATLHLSISICMSAPTWVIIFSILLTVWFEAQILCRKVHLKQPEKFQIYACAW